jgi:hypothetical protein
MIVARGMNVAPMLVNLRKARGSLAKTTKKNVLQLKMP